MPADSVRLAGMNVFLGKPCAICHNINGLPASGQVGPDLTHLASRRTLAAGVIPNTKGHLGGWILNPQAIKPGTRMPPNALSPSELDALLAYLGGLR
jgi:cytochrome c oxidase subunit 2